MRAAAYLYLKETYLSFEVERVKPSATKAQRFAGLLHDAEASKPLSEVRFVELQNAVVDPRFAEASYRQSQNWVGTDYGHRVRIDFVPQRPEDVRALMDGLVALMQRVGARPDAIDSVVAALPVFRSPLRLDAYLEYSVPLMRQEIVGSDDVIQREAVRDHHVKVNPPRFDHPHQTPHALLAAGA